MSTTPAPTKDWTVEAADTVDSIVGLVRDKATVPLRTVVRAIVYGIALAVVGGTAAVLGTVALVRALIVYIPVGYGPDHHRRVWLVYLGAGGLFALIGLFLLGAAERTPKEDG